MPIKMKILMLSIIAVSAISSSTAMAKIYKWTDSTGKVHYTAQPPSAKNKAKIEEINIRKKPASSLTHQPSVEIVKDKVIKKTKKEILTSKSTAADNCNQLIDSLPGLSNKQKSAEKSKCKKEIAKTKDKAKKKQTTSSSSFSAFPPLNGSGTADNPIVKRTGKRTSRDIINHYETAMKKRHERKMSDNQQKPQ